VVFTLLSVDDQRDFPFTHGALCPPDGVVLKSTSCCSMRPIKWPRQSLLKADLASMSSAPEMFSQFQASTSANEHISVDLHNAPQGRITKVIVAPAYTCQPPYDSAINIDAILKHELGSNSNEATVNISLSLLPLVTPQWKASPISTMRTTILYGGEGC